MYILNLEVRKNYITIKKRFFMKRVNILILIYIINIFVKREVTVNLTILTFLSLLIYDLVTLSKKDKKKKVKLLIIDIVLLVLSVLILRL